MGVHSILVVHLHLWAFKLHLDNMESTSRSDIDQPIFHL